jgi:aspartate aminotransferase
MILSDRITQLEESATLAMAAKARELKASGKNVISLSLGEPDFKTPAHICDGAKEAIDSGKYFSYPPVPGYQDLREALAEKLRKENNISSEAANIVVSNGAKQSIANVFHSILNPGDEVIVYSPFWVSYSAIIQLAGGQAVYIKGGIDNDFKASSEQLEAAITDKTKAIIYSSPCNPTGSVFTRSELEEIAAVLKKFPEILVVADEIYEHINYEGEHLSLGSFKEIENQVVTVNGFAKGFAMTGWRVGYINAPVQLAKACSKMQGQITSANCSIAQRAALTAITTDLGPTYNMVKEYRKRRDLVADLLKEIPGIKINIPKGAFYFFPDVSEYFGKSNGDFRIRNADDFCMFLLEHAHVSLVTGAAFGEPKSVRLSYAASTEDLREAIKRMKEVLSKFN